LFKQFNKDLVRWWKQ